MKLVRAMTPFLMLAACAGSRGGDEDGGSEGMQLAVSGKAMTAASRSIAGASVRTITHVMAVNPESATADRALAEVKADGSFALSLGLDRPYVLVFVDATARGADMAVGMLRAGTLDTFSAQAAGSLDLGTVMVEPSNQTAAAGITYDALIAGLGLSADAAAYLGSVDDLSLRYANPDIDGDGVIDMQQDHHYGLDFHVRASMQVDGRDVTIADLTDAFLADSGPHVATPVFNLTSAYVEYAAALDATTYVSTAGGPSLSLQNGAAFHVTQADGSLPALPTSFSAVAFGDTRGWGADYDYGARAGLELPGSGGSPATLRYTLGASATTLTFTNVVTRTRASLTDQGSLAIFVKLNTTDGKYASIDYQWMKRASATTWVPATADEIALTIGSDGGYLSFHHTPMWSNEFGTRIPPQPSGTIAWTFQATAPSEVCSLAVSFDDKLGLRHFVGGASGNAGVTCSFN
jgi:hypothetical protein